MENCVMLAECHEGLDDMTTVPERLRALEVQMEESRKAHEDYRRESKHERRNMQVVLEGRMVKMEQDQSEIKNDLGVIKDFFQQAKGVKWFIGFVTTTIAALSSIGIYKLFFPK